MTDSRLDFCLAAVAWAGETDSAAWGAIAAQAIDLVVDPEVAIELLNRLVSAPDLDGGAPEATLLQVVLDQARMDRENDGAAGAAALDALAEATAALARDTEMTQTGIVRIARAYAQARLEPPEVIWRTGEAAAATAGSMNEEPDIDAMLDQLRDEAGSEPFALHTALTEMLATVDPEPRGAIVARISARTEPLFRRLALYWLLDPVRSVRAGAAAAVRHAAETQSLDAATAAHLAALRTWMPEDNARVELDRALRALMRRRPADNSSTLRPVKRHRILASLPDGAGAQTIAIAAQRGSARGVGMLLLKQGFGVADAYVLPCDSASEQRRLLSRIEEEAPVEDTAAAFLGPAIAAALAENIATGVPPAPGLIEVAELCGLDPVRPQALTVAERIAGLDPEGVIAALPPQKLGLLINASEDWLDRYEAMESWFENSAALQKALDFAITSDSRRKAVWRHLTGRRDWWAAVIARGAETLKAQDDPVWSSLAAVALALVRGRPLPKVPIMRHIHETTLEITDGPGWSGLADRLGPPDPEETVSLEMASPETPGELAALMAGAGMQGTPEWLEGYLTAVAVAPRMIAPTDCVSALLEQPHEFPDQPSMIRWLELVLGRYNALNATLSDNGAISERLRTQDATALSNWATGFVEAIDDHRGAWRGVAKDDKSMLRLLAATAEGHGAPAEAASLLPTWLSARYARRS